MTNEKCLTCKFFEHLFNEQGRCHRYAPRPDEGEAERTWWPRVEASDFCGEFVQSPKQDKEQQ